MAGSAAALLFLETRPFLLRRINAPFNTFQWAWLDSCLTFQIFTNVPHQVESAHLRYKQAGWKGKRRWGLSSSSPSADADHTDPVQLGRWANFLPLTGNIGCQQQPELGNASDVSEADETITMFTGKVKNLCGMRGDWAWCKYGWTLGVGGRGRFRGQGKRQRNLTKVTKQILELPAQGKLEASSAQPNKCSSPSSFIFSDGPLGIWSRVTGESQQWPARLPAWRPFLGVQL